MEKKYRYEQATQEDVEKFNQDFRALLEKHSLIAETQPSIGRIIKENGEGTAEFSLRGSLVLSKKIEVVQAEIVSDNPEVNPQA